MVGTDRARARSRRAQSVEQSYDALAFAYDAFTADFAHERWVSELEGLARAHGLRGRRLLDVACGTGKSFLPFLEFGYDVTACDLSKPMLKLAAAKTDRARLFQADMRALPDVGSFDLVTCLDDALNYLETEDELIAALRGLCRSLAADGLAVWDVNTLAMYRGDFSSQWAIERDGLFMIWRGRAAPDLEPGDRAEATIDLFRPIDGDGDRDCWHHARSVHRQRHWPADRVRGSASSAGLRILAVHGQHRGARLEPRLDESEHRKAVFVACREDRRTATKGGDRHAHR
jgi:SAM-dependent methyltransferase